MVTFRALAFSAASSQYAGRGSGVPSGQGDYTSMVWAYLDTSDGNEFPISLGSSSSNYDDLRWHASDYIRLTSRTAGVSQTADSSTLSTGWHHLAIVRSGTTLTAYIDGAQAAQVTQDTSARTAATDLWFGRSHQSSTTYSNEDQFAAKTWTRALSAAEVRREMSQVNRWNAASIYGAWPDLGEDVSGTGNDLTKFGSPPNSNPPGIAYDLRLAQVRVLGEAAAGGASGSGGFTTPMPTASGSGAASRTGTGGFSTPVPTTAGAGAAARTGAGGFTSPMPTLDGTGEAAAPAVGTGGFTTPVPALTGGGEAGRVGTGGFDLPVPTLSGAGEAARTGTGGFTTPMPTMAGSDEALAVVSCGQWSTAQTFDPCDEWRVVLSGPSATNLRVRLSLRFRYP